MASTRLVIYVAIYRNEHERAMEDIPNYLGNPIHAFTLIKRMTMDLEVIDNEIQTGIDHIKNISLTENGGKYPTKEDLSGAAQALTRLQDTYQLDVHDLAEGVINGESYSTPLTASDCYELGRALYSVNDHKNSLPWMMEALRKFEMEKETQTFTKIDILEHIGFSYYLIGDVDTALLWTQKLLVEAPTHPRALGNVPHYKKYIKERDEKLRKRQRGETGVEELEDTPPPKKESTLWNEKERKSYEALCRGDVDIPTEISKKLKCRYLTENHPFLKLAPLKVEEKYLNPNVYVFHQVLSDEEIEFVKDVARPRFKRAVVHNPETGELVPAHYRISKSSWLRDDESPVIERISQRTADISGLDMVTAEELQVVNYGIGGHYEPHFDFARMSDVAQGGATVFTELGLSVFPEKGAALFWHNLHPSGEGDFATRHAACPVLRGSKWVSNKWIHQGGQEFLRPCNLEYQREGMIRPTLRPVPKSYR
ncbi:Prolyl 4-hydroxylase subunit alpha-2 [Eumeta japonica]|uniref:procollagen-proline 4-dioxygenase n=1 Tax=Eumeta variegata TaxID=151549 RepID=A0A4C2A8S5_EUMVA|nr:Prolyl 4-hydroxylase subunit alpha-2 [Eumeta japonica]